MKNLIDLNRRAFIAETIKIVSAGSLCFNAFGQDRKLHSNSLRSDIVSKIQRLRIPQTRPIRVLYPDGSLENLKPIINAFEADTGIPVLTLKSDVDTINTRIILSAMSDQDTFDVAIPATFGIPDLVESGAIANLSDLAFRHEPVGFQDSSLFSTGDYYQGDFYGYQADGDAYLMFYNKAWLEDPEEVKRFEDTHNFPLATPKTWQELDAMMAFFHRPDEGKYGGCLFRSVDYVAWEWWIRLHANGSYPADPEMRPLLASEAGVTALEAIIKSAEHQHPSARSNGLFDNWKVYAEANCFANIGWGGTQKFLLSDESRIKDSLSFGKVPGGALNEGTFHVPYFNWGWNYVVSNLSAQKERAYLFTLYASTPELSSSSIEQAGGYFDPFRKEHYKNQNIIDTYGLDFLETHRDSMSNCLPDFYMYGYREYFSALKENIHLTFKSVLDPELALKNTVKDWEEITERAGRSKQIKQWRFLRSVYPTSIKRALG